jgi:hypothetical protein
MMGAVVQEQGAFWTVKSSLDVGVEGLVVVFFRDASQRTNPPVGMAKRTSILPFL